jgi:hypothetical protein
MQHHLFVAAGLGGAHQRLQHLATHGRAAQRCDDGHAADLRKPRHLLHPASSRQRQTKAVVGHGVHASGVGLVPFQRGGDLLLLHEDFAAYGLGIWPQLGP